MTRECRVQSRAVSTAEPADPILPNGEKTEKRRLKVLIVEDEADLGLVLSIRLRNAGYDVAVANNGEEGVELAVRDEPDAIVLDLGLPDLDGAGVIRVLRTVKMTRDTPIIILTGRETEDVAQLVEGWDVVRRIIRKPISGKTLARVLDSVLGRDEAP
ncbi:MAG: response regulator [Planctomycetota bacterium]